MNRSCISLVALLGLSLLSISAARGQSLSDDSETFAARPKTFSQLLDMIGDCAHGVVHRYDALEQGAAVAQAADFSDEAAGQDEFSDASTQSPPSGDEETVAQEAAPDTITQTADQDYLADYLANQDLIANESQNPSVDPAIEAATTGDSAEDAEYQYYTDYRDGAAAASNAIANEGQDADADWSDEPAADQVAAPAAAPIQATEPCDAEPGETYQASETAAEAPLDAENRGFGRQALLGVADLLDQLGAALQNVSCELTSLAAQESDNIKR